jgi:G3E family GTPase
MDDKIIPVYLLTGFLGSGKTTLLNLLLEDAREKGLKPAVLMNEVGDVNVEGQLIGRDIPMAEMLGGCICCTSRADLGMELIRLAQEHRPDVIWIESTGVAQPLEIMDAVTEAALYEKLELKNIVTVIDSRHLLDRIRIGSGKTLKLMREQIHAANTLVLNKVDLIRQEEQAELLDILADWNPFAKIITTVKTKFDADVIYISDGPKHAFEQADTAAKHDHHDHHHNSQHDHVSVLTHYLSGTLDSHEFERFLRDMPQEVYRAKGIVTFRDTASRFLFQYAYRETDFMRIAPHETVHDVAVFIGEGFSQKEIIAQLQQLATSGDR